MMKNQPTSEQFAAYEAMFGYFNHVLFRNELPPVILNFSRHAGSYGFFAPERWTHGAGGSSKTHEISINPTHLASRPPRDTASTLVHEMCHLWQHVYGTPPRRGYHDREWAQKMRSVGLIPIDPKTGEEKMSAHRLSHKIDPSGAFALAFASMPPAFVLPWSCAELDACETKKPKAKSRNKVKYTCPSCGSNVWGKPELAIGCGECDVEFVEGA